MTRQRKSGGCQSRRRSTKGSACCRELATGAFRYLLEQSGLNKLFTPLARDFRRCGCPTDIRTSASGPKNRLTPRLRRVVLRNKGKKEFAHITASSGTGKLHKRLGVVFADIDNAPRNQRRIKVRVKNGTGRRAAYRTIGSGGSFRALPLEQQIGLVKSRLRGNRYWPRLNADMRLRPIRGPLR